MTLFKIHFEKDVKFKIFEVFCWLHCRYIFMLVDNRLRIIYNKKLVQWPFYEECKAPHKPASWEAVEIHVCCMAEHGWLQMRNVLAESGLKLSLLFVFTKAWPRVLFTYMWRMVLYASQHQDMRGVIRLYFSFEIEANKITLRFIAWLKTSEADKSFPQPPSRFKAPSRGV